MVTYTITDGTTIYDVAQLGGIKDGENLDVYTVIANGKYPNDTNVIVYYDTTPLFYGIVKKVEEEDQGSTYKLTCYERAVELKGMQYLSGSSPIFTKTSMTVTALVTDILSGSGWTNGSTDSTVISVFSCYYVNKLQALQKIIRETRGLYIWFNSSTKTVYYGMTGTDYSSVALSYMEKKLSSSTEARNVTKVIVLGKDESIVGTAGTGTIVATYQVTDITVSSEAESMAATILADLGNEYDTYIVTIDPSQYKYGARDKVLVDGTVYYVKEVDHTLNEIKLTIDSGSVSVIDSLGSRITEVSGSFPSGSDASWSGGNTNVAANAASYTTYVFNIADISMVANALLDATISSFQVSTGVAASTDYLSDVSQVVNNSSYSGSTGVIGYSTWYLPDGVSSDTSCYGMTATAMANGYQFGNAVAIGSFAHNTGYTLTLQWQVAFVTTGSPPYNWADIGAPMYVDETSVTVMTLPTLIDGSTLTATPHYRLKLTGTANQYKAYSVRMYVQRVTRHLHSVSTTYDKTTAGTPPSTVTIKVNSGTDTVLTPGTPLNIQSLLITGKNIISIKTPSGASNQCSVNPTITYQSLGKS